ncbi:MAG: acyl-CoA dehydrogenase family protein, partial [Dehalococcoidia bacterium]
MRQTLSGDFIAAARALAPEIQAAREELDTARRLPIRVVQALTEAGLFQLFLPRSMGGPEVDPITFFHVIEELSMMDGSVGWCALLSSAGSIYAGSLSVDVGRSLFGQPPDFRGAGSFRPLGEARIVEGGYRVSGRWDYASGIDHARHLFFSCRVVDD